MRDFRQRAFLAACAAAGLSLGTGARAQISSFNHVILMVQENRTPDNLFQGLCSPPYGSSSSCSTTPTGSQYDILTSNWLDHLKKGGVEAPAAVILANDYDLGHAHADFISTCDLNSSGVCKMDGAGTNVCVPNAGEKCPPTPEYKYVTNKRATILRILIIGLMAGPAVSLYGSPTVSPVTAAL